jgi:hypothetical protein
MDWMMLIVLCITHGAFYYMGRSDGQAMTQSDDAWVEVEKYEIDKRFEYMRWRDERGISHEG